LSSLHHLHPTTHASPRLCSLSSSSHHPRCLLSRSRHHPFLSSLIVVLAIPQFRLLLSFPTALSPHSARTFLILPSSPSRTCYPNLVGCFFPFGSRCPLHLNCTQIILELFWKQRVLTLNYIIHYTRILITSLF
jgi:hypothetical protein